MAPRDDMEERVADVWRQFFGIDQVGVHDNFFELGGTSLLATQLVNSLQKTFKVELDVPTFMRSATVAELSETLVRLQDEEETAQATAVLDRLEQMSEDEIAALLAQTEMAEA